MPERIVEWTDVARDDLRAIVFHIALDSVQNALTVMEKIEHRALTLSALSTRGRIVPELRRLGEKSYRELIEAPWRLIYDIQSQRVRILAIVDGRRNLDEWLNERAMRFHLSKK